MDSHEQNNLSEIKFYIIEEINKRFEEHSIEETNANLIKRLVQNTKNKEDAIMIWKLGTMLAKTRINFNRDFEKVLDEKDTIHYLKRNHELSFKTDENAPLHKLIIGENFYALNNLLISYRGKIDVIYIDPPYGKDSMGEFAATNYHNAISRDNLLTMLEIRLEIAKMLLSDTGVIFCSIDDKNQAYVKCLFDDIFGERNFVANFPRITVKGGKTQTNLSTSNCDYILSYTKNINLVRFNKIKIEDDPSFKFQDEYYEKRGPYHLKQTLDSESLGYVPSLDYPIIYKDKTYYPGSTKEKNNFRWTWSQEKLKFAIENDFVIFKENRVFPKKYLCASIEKNEYGYYIEYLDRTKNYSQLHFTENEFSNPNATKDLKELGLDNKFSYSKPKSLVKDLLKMSSNPSSIVLDFFAGSGTTAQAVQELNKEDGGNRECILVQMNEKTATTPNGIASDVTAKRLKRVMTGSCYDGSTDFEWIKKNAPLGGNLDVYDIDDVSVNESNDGKSAFDVIDETIYGCEKFGTFKDKVDWVCSNFSITTPKIEKGKTNA